MAFTGKAHLRDQRARETVKGAALMSSKRSKDWITFGRVNNPKRVQSNMWTPLSTILNIVEMFALLQPLVLPGRLLLCET